MPLTVHRADRADVLVEGLARLLQSPPEDPFALDVVVVAAAGVERWVAQRLSHRLGTQTGRDDGICAGVDFRRPAHLVSELTERDVDDPWAPDRLTWTALELLETHLHEPWLAVVARHLGAGHPDVEARLRRARRFGTARRVASLLHSYAVQRPEMVAAWRVGDDTDGRGQGLPEAARWQAELWRRLVARLAPHPSPDRRLAETAERLRAGTVPLTLGGRISFVGHTRMPRAELDVVAALGVHRDVHLWLPHPSRRRWERTAGSAPAGKGAAGATPLRTALAAPGEGNLLLTSCGRDAAELQHTLTTLTHGGPGPLEVEHLPPPERPTTMLGFLQADLVEDHELAPVDPTRRVTETDRSLQVHACHGPARQVDVLREVLLGLLQDDPTLQLRDVIVMCPDVETFAPLVHAAFGLDDVEGVDHPGHRLRVRLADRATSAVNPVAEVLQRVAAIAAEGRARVADVVDLLALAPVRRRFGLSADDLEQVEAWAGDTAIRWGLDADARDLWGLGGLAQNTWAAGLDRLAVSVVSDTGDGTRPGDVLPLDDLSSTDIDLVGRLHELVDRLHRVVDALAAGETRDWRDALTTAVETLTDVTGDDAWQREQVLRTIAGLGPGGGNAEGADGGGLDSEGAGSTDALGPSEVVAVLDHAFAARPSRTSFRTGAVTVCTMVPMRSVPHRVVCLLGLDADTFPRVATPLGDDVLALAPRVGERDTAGEDRQLFLDAVLSATEHLVITYTGASEHSGRTLPPATPVGELLDQLERSVPAAATGRRNVREQVVVRHPLQAFDESAFVPGTIVAGEPFSFDTAALAGARAARNAPAPVPPLIGSPLPAVEEDVVSLQDLRDFVAHPVRAFVRQRLGVRLPYESDPQETGIPLQLDGLAQWQLNERLLGSVLAGAAGEQADADARRSGLLPPAPLAGAALQQAHDLVIALFGIAAPWREEDASAVDVDHALPDGRRIVGTVTGVRPSGLLTVTASTLKGRQLTEPWVDLLALAAAGFTAPARIVGRVPTGWRKHPGIVTLRAPTATEADRILTDLLDQRAEGLRLPLPLPIKTSEPVATTMLRTQDLGRAERAARSEWEGNRNRDIKGEADDAYHRLALGDCSVEDLLRRGLDRHALRLWTPLLEHREAT